MNLISVNNLILQFDLECRDEELETKVKQFVADVNFALVRLFKEQAPHILNSDNKINITVEKIKE